MRKEYDLAGMKGRRNPYARRLKKHVTTRMGVDIIEYFKELSQETMSIKAVELRNSRPSSATSCFCTVVRSSDRRGSVPAYGLFLQ